MIYAKDELNILNITIIASPIPISIIFSRDKFLNASNISLINFIIITYLNVSTFWQIIQQVHKVKC